MQLLNRLRLRNNDVKTKSFEMKVSQVVTRDRTYWMSVMLIKCDTSLDTTVFDRNCSYLTLGVI